MYDYVSGRSRCRQYSRTILVSGPLQVHKFVDVKARVQCAFPIPPSRGQLELSVVPGERALFKTESCATVQAWLFRV